MTLLLILGYAGLFIFFLVFGQSLIRIIYGPAYHTVAIYLPIAIIIFCIISIREVYKVSLYSIKEPGVYLGINFIGVGVYLLAILIGYYVINVHDLIVLILLSIGLSNLFITIGSIYLYKRKFRMREDQLIYPSVIE